VYEVHTVIEKTNNFLHLSLRVVDYLLVHVLRDLTCKCHSYADDSGSVETRKTAEDLVRAVTLSEHMMRR
jgi:hypothetical protein